MTKREQQQLLREERAARKEETRLRNLNSRWVLLGANGYYLFTACSKCSTQAYCRGKHRDTVECKTCFMKRKR